MNRDMKMSGETGQKSRNPVAKHAKSFNRAQVHQDRKKAEKRGKRRHKKQWVDTKAA